MFQERSFLSIYRFKFALTARTGKKTSPCPVTVLLTAPGVFFKWHISSRDMVHTLQKHMGEVLIHSCGLKRLPCFFFFFL